MTHPSKDQIERARKCLEEAQKILADFPPAKRESVKKEVWVEYNPNDECPFYGIYDTKPIRAGGSVIILHGVLEEVENG